MLVDTIEALQDAGHQVVFVATCRARPGQQVTEEHFASLARSLSADFVTTRNLNVPDAVAWMRAGRADVAVSVDWPNLLGPDACGSFPQGILNAHGGDLPRYRGNSPVAWAMVRGEPRIGLTIHRMDPVEYDAGPIVCKEYFELTRSTYIRDVYDFIEARVPHLFLAAVEALARGSARLLPQSEAGPVLRFHRRTEADGRLSWHEPAEYLARLVHATAEPYAGAFTSYEGRRMTVWRAEAREWAVSTPSEPGRIVRRDAQSGEVAVVTGAGALALQEVETAAKGRRRATEVIRDARQRLGDIDEALSSDGWPPAGRPP